MPLINDFKAQEAGKREVLPEDVYQVSIDDIELKQMPSLKDSRLMQDNLIFRCNIVTEGEQQGKRILFFTSTKWFPGNSNAEPSKLYVVIKTIMAFYSPATDIKTFTSDKINSEFINKLIGKQIRVTLESKDGKSRVRGFMAIKNEIKTPSLEEEIAEADAQ